MTYEHDIPSKDDSEPIISSPLDVPWRELRAIERVVKNFEIFGVQTKFALYSRDECIAGQNIDTPTEARSVSKLPLVCMAIDQLSPTLEVIVKKEDILDDGSWLNHVTDDTTVTVSQLVDAAIRESSNTAFRALAQLLNGPGAINEYYKERQWENTSVGVDETSGRALMGNTTMQEAYMQLRSLLNDQSGDPTLRIIAQQGLKNNTVTRYGIRQSVTPTDTLTIFNKTGEIRPGPLRRRCCTGS